MIILRIMTGVDGFGTLKSAMKMMKKIDRYIIAASDMIIIYESILSQLPDRSSRRYFKIA